MTNFIAESIIPLSELRSNLKQVKHRLKKNPLIITTNGRPDFGVCDLETLEFAIRIKSLKDLLQMRLAAKEHSEDAGLVFKTLEKKYHGKKG